MRVVLSRAPVKRKSKEATQFGFRAGSVASATFKAAVAQCFSLPVYAQMVIAESGVDPLEADAAGFQQRWLRRIEQSRVWVWIEDGRLIFNADIMCDTPDCVYLEGIYVDPDERGKDYGLRCLSQLSRNLLQRAKSICLLVNEQNKQAQTFYHKAGFTLCGYYDTIFLHLKN